MVKRGIRAVERKTTKATIKRIDGAYSVDISIQGSPSLIRNVYVSGVALNYRIGQIVTISWANGRPVVVSNG